MKCLQRIRVRGCTVSGGARLLNVDIPSREVPDCKWRLPLALLASQGPGVQPAIPTHVSCSVLLSDSLSQRGEWLSALDGVQPASLRVVDAAYAPEGMHAPAYLGLSGPVQRTTEVHARLLGISDRYACIDNADPHNRWGSS